MSVLALFEVLLIGVFVGDGWWWVFGFLMHVNVGFL